MNVHACLPAAHRVIGIEYRHAKKPRKAGNLLRSTRQVAPLRAPLHHIKRVSRVSRMQSTPIMLTAAAIDTYAPTQGSPPRAASICAIYGATDAPRIPPRLYDTPAPV